MFSICSYYTTLVIFLVLYRTSLSLSYFYPASVPHLCRGGLEEVSLLMFIKQQQSGRPFHLLFLAYFSQSYLQLVILDSVNNLTTEGVEKVMGIIYGAPVLGSCLFSLRSLSATNPSKCIKEGRKFLECVGTEYKVF